jgi:purine nucleoside permease
MLTIVNKSNDEKMITAMIYADSSKHMCTTDESCVRGELEDASDTEALRSAATAGTLEVRRVQVSEMMHI